MTVAITLISLTSIILSIGQMILARRLGRVMREMEIEDGMAAIGGKFHASSEDFLADLERKIDE